MKYYQAKHSIAYQLPKTVFAIYFVIVVLITALYFVIEYQNTKNNIRDELGLIAESFKPDLKNALQVPDNERIQEVGQNILNLSNIVSVHVVDASGNSLYVDGKDVASSDAALFFEELIIDKPLSNERIHLAKVKLYSDSDVVWDRVNPGYLIALLVGVSLLMYALLVWALKKLIHKPIQKLIDDLDTIGLDNINKHGIDLHTEGDNEFKAVEAACNQMLRTLELDKKELLKVENNYQNILEKEVSERTQELELSNKQLNALAATDPLTQIRNRRSFFDIAGKYYSIAIRTKEALAVMMIDLDHFKSVNDKYGHASGDEALIEFTRIVKKQLRDSDLFARYGGEEFVVVLANTGIEGAEKLAEKIRYAIETNYLVTEKGEIQVTASIGVAELIKQDTSLEDILSRADKGLYLAKENGRNRIEKMAA
jgi:diguanylate cyclase (GGDEF)-like protein